MLTYLDLFRIQIVWNRRMGQLRPSYCKYWRKLCRPAAFQWRKGLYWGLEWLPRMLNHIQKHWPGAKHHPRPWKRKQHNFSTLCWIQKISLGSYPSSNGEIIMTGPNDSSLAMYMWSCTLVKTVGRKKKPGRSARLPPVTKVAPSFSPISQYSINLSKWALWFCGPCCVPRSSGSPIA